MHHLYACLLCLKISNVDFMLPLLKQSLELNCVRANSICYLVLIKFWKNWAERGACSVVMATTVFQNFSCPLYWLNFGVGILSNIFKLKLFFINANSMSIILLSIYSVMRMKSAKRENMGRKGAST